MASNVEPVGAQSLDVSAGQTMASGTREYAASFGQQRLWVIDRLKPDHSLYNITLVADLAGPLNLIALESSFTEIVRRHEGLRTRFRVRGGRPFQEVHSHVRPVLAIVDLQYLPAEAQTRAAEQARKAIAERPFKLDQLPLFSLCVISAGPLRHVLVFSVHHIIFDHWSQEIVVREFAQLYAAYTRGQQIRMTPPSMQYASVSEFQREKLQGESLQKLLEFWSRQWASPEPLPTQALPFRKGADVEMRFAGRTLVQNVTGDTLASLRRMVRSQGKSLFSIALAAFMVTLHRYTSSGKTLVTVPVPGRDRQELQDVVGFMVNLLPICLQIDPEKSFQATVDAVADRFLAALENQELPFDKMVEMFEPQRYYGGGRLSQVVFGYRRIGRWNFDIGELKVMPRDVPGTRARFELSAMIIERESQMEIGIEYNSDCYDETDMQRLLQNYIATLIRLSQKSNVAMKHVPLLSEEEKRQQLEEWNGREEVGEWRGGVLEGIMGVAGRQGDAVAVKCGAETLSYGELVRRSGRIAGWLREEAGGGPERLIGVWVERSVETVVALLGVLQSGAAYVALDAQGPMERCAELIEEAELEWVLMGGKEGRKRKAELERLCRVVEGGEVVREGQRWKGKVEAESLAYVLFTSGSTGRPKGVMVSHQNLATSTWARFAYYGEAAVERYLLLSPLFFDSSVAGLYWTLCSGGCVVIPEEGEQREGGRVAEIVEEERISHVLCIPSLYEVLMEEWEREGKGEGETGETLKVAIVAGEACNAGLVRRHEERLGEVKLCNEYGPTEGTVWSAVSGGEELRGRDPVPIGRGVGTMRSYIEDEEGELLPVGAQGEIVVGGSGVARGYWKQGGVTAERFVPDKWSRKEGERSYRTGDLGRWSGEGQIVFEGRKDDEVKIRGHRISLGEVESVLRRHGGVKEAAAAVVEKGGGRQLVAYVVVQEGETAGREKLREFLCQRLPQAVVPAQIQLVSALPKLPNGKLDRNRLVEMAGIDTAVGHVTEQLDPVEGLIADVWKEVLGCEVIGLEDNFFEIGGHSLLATQVLSRMRSLFDRSIVLRSFFEHPTLRGLADQIKRAQLSPSLQEEMPAIRARSRQERPPLSFQQQRLWFLYEANRSNTDYILPRAIRLCGELSIELLDRTLREIIRRHETLRTSFATENGRPYMVINSAAAWQLPIQQVDGPSSEEKLNEVIRRMNDEVRCPFILEQEAVRFILYRMMENDHVLFINMHHIITDGWSLGLLMRELRILLLDFQEGRPSSLPELPFQYSDFATWQREWLQGPRLDSYIDHWEKELETALAGSLPPTRDHITGEPFAGRSLFFHTGPELAQKVRALCRETGSTLYTVFESLFAASVAWHSGIPDVMIGTSVANRRDPRAESLIGFFSNTLPIRTRLDADCTYRSLFQQAKQTALKAFALEDVPIESIVSRLRRAGALSREESLFDTFFVLHNEPIQELSIPGLHAEFVDIHNPTTMFKLSGSVSEKNDGFLYMLHYDSNYLAEETVLSLGRSFGQLLASAAAAPDAVVFDALAEDASAALPHFSASFD
jgi:amino acid adenylation domain-containing protein